MMPSTKRLKERLGSLAPQTAIILGSGLGSLVDKVKDPIKIPYNDLEGFPHGGVSGHAGELVAGYIGNQAVLMLSGRVHYYEQANAAAMRIPIETMAELGIKNLILTNSAGSVRQDLPPGSVMLITDHINWSGLNPLIGEQTDRRFVGMTNAYNSKMMNNARKSAAHIGITMGEGVYMWFSGPSFETPAEITMARNLGADAVGMSTVPEVILARFCGLEVTAFSVITNFGAGMTGAELSHDETKQMAPLGGERLGKIIAAMVGGVTK